MCEEGAENLQEGMRSYLYLHTYQVCTWVLPWTTARSQCCTPSGGLSAAKGDVKLITSDPGSQLKGANKELITGAPGSQLKGANKELITWK